MGACMTGFVDLDGLPQNGCECQLSESGAEICDGKDNDCDGSVDQGFDLQTDVANCGGLRPGLRLRPRRPPCAPGASAAWRPARPAFTISTARARNGCEYACPASNDGVEICDGQDNDCDGDVDESDPREGARCYPQATPWAATSPRGACAGLCALGTFACLPGGLTCRGAKLPEVDQCDGLDNDCDGAADEDYDLQNDPRWCGGCGRLCQLPNAVNGCSAGACVVRSCLAGWVDLDAAPANGCEYACTADGPEVCDGKDNDCDGRIDVDDPDLLFPPTNFCAQAGECGKGPGGSPRYPQATFPRLPVERPRAARPTGSATTRRRPSCSGPTRSPGRRPAATAWTTTATAPSTRTCGRRWARSASTRPASASASGGASCAARPTRPPPRSAT